MGWNDQIGTEAAVGKKAGLPQVLEQQLGEGSVDEIALLIERGFKIKQDITALQNADKEIREKLGELAAVNGLDGFRHNDLVYTQRLQPGRVTVSMEKLKEGLVTEGVRTEVINRCIELATKQGEGFWVREISVLKK